MFCYVMSCYVMLCMHVMYACFVMSCHAMLCMHVVPCDHSYRYKSRHNNYNRACNIETPVVLCISLVTAYHDRVEHIKL